MKVPILNVCPGCGWNQTKKKEKSEVCIKCDHSLVLNGKGHQRQRKVFNGRRMSRR